MDTIAKIALIGAYVAFAIWGIKHILSFVGVDLFSGLPPCAMAMLCRLEFANAFDMYIKIILAGFTFKRLLSYAT